MSYVPGVNVDELERAVYFAVDDMVEHESRCAVMGPFCDECLRVNDAVENAEARLDAARSQLPDRGAFPHLRGDAA